jgi:ferredoxin
MDVREPLGRQPYPEVSGSRAVAMRPGWSSTPCSSSATRQTLVIFSPAESAPGLTSIRKIRPPLPTYPPGVWPWLPRPRWWRSHRAEIEAEEDAVRVEVNPNICEGHGQCNAVAPEVYDLDEGGYCLIHNSEVPPDLKTQAEEGALACPVQAITVTR